MPPPAVLAIHGGAGPATSAVGGAGGWPAEAQALAGALRAGLRILRAGGPALDAVVAAVAVLEDDARWNAGRGSALTSAGTVEMDASLADGRGRRFGAVACVTGVRHPIEAARVVLEDGRHVLLAGPGAVAFASAAGLRFESPDWFVTPSRLQELIARAVERDSGEPERPVARVADGGVGTVGAVARDQAGHLAAATSTGGRNGQLPGRVGDSPIPGAGTWADDATCAISATGIGEAFIRAAFAHEVDARLRLDGRDLGAACGAALDGVHAAGGDGGCIAVGPEGPPLLVFTTELMHRGWAEVGGPLWVAARPGPLQRIDQDPQAG